MTTVTRMETEALQYSEKIEFAKYGIRMAVLEKDGRLVHHDNWDLDMFGGVLPDVGDHITTLWDPERPDPAESYLVRERHWVGELMGDNCWWLLLEEVTPSGLHRQLFELARHQSAETRRILGGSYHEDLAEIRREIEKRKGKATSRRGMTRSPTKRK